VAAPARLRAAVDVGFADQVAMIEAMESWFGPYPFASGYAVVVTDDDLEIPLESQTLSTFGANLIDRTWESQRLIAHELAHQWWGNSVTAGGWDDIWLHEGFACYSEWLWSPLAGLESTDARARHHWARLARLPQDLVLAAPGPKDMFDDRVYKRGALTLHALRLEVGDEAFFTVLREFQTRHRYGVVSTADLESLAARVAGRRLTALFDAWLRSPELPALPSM
jgi:aminopeptidase N